MFGQPAIGVGNVGQLCVDVLLANSPDAVKIGYFHDESLLPVVANDALAVSPANCKGTITLAVEGMSVSVCPLPL